MHFSHPRNFLKDLFIIIDWNRLQHISSNWSVNTVACQNVEKGHLHIIIHHHLFLSSPKKLMTDKWNMENKKKQREGKWNKQLQSRWGRANNQSAYLKLFGSVNAKQVTASHSCHTDRYGSRFSGVMLNKKCVKYIYRRRARSTHRRRLVSCVEFPHFLKFFSFQKSLAICTRTKFVWVRIGQMYVMHRWNTRTTPHSHFTVCLPIKEKNTCTCQEKKTKIIYAYIHWSSVLILHCLPLLCFLSFSILLFPVNYFMEDWPLISLTIKQQQKKVLESLSFSQQKTAWLVHRGSCWRSGPEVGWDCHPQGSCWQWSI